MLGEEPAVAWAKSIRDPSSLSDAEAKIVDSYLVNLLLLYTRSARMEEAGLTDLSLLELTIRSSAWLYFGNPFARRWWRNDREIGGWDPDIVRILDEEIARLDSGSSERWLNDLLWTDGSRDIPLSMPRDAGRAGERRGKDVRRSGPVETIDHQAVPNILPSFGAFQPSPVPKHRKEIVVIRHAESTSCRVVQRTTILGCEDGRTSSAHRVGLWVLASRMRSLGSLASSQLRSTE